MIEIRKHSEKWRIAKLPQYLQKVLEEIIKDERLKESRVD